MVLKEYSLGELLKYEQPTKYIVSSTNYDDSYQTPVLTAGKSFVLGYTDERDGIYEKDDLPVIIFDDFTTSSQYVDFPFKVKSSAMKILTPNKDLVLPKYIYYRMQIIQFDHSTHKRYWIQQYSKIKVSIPELEEQKEIVKKIEKLFSQLDNSEKELNTINGQLKVYRQAVIKDAFSKINKYVELGSLIEKPRYGTSKKCTYEKKDESLEVYRIPNIQAHVGIISHDDIKYAEFNDSELADLNLKENDLLLIRSNGSVSLVGRTAIVRKCDEKGTFAGYLIRLRLKDANCIAAKYLQYYFESHEARFYIEKTAKSTSGVNNINSEEIKRMHIPWGDNELQNEVVAEIESKLSTCDSIDKMIVDTLVRADVMRQSILKDAFEGRL